MAAQLPYPYPDELLYSVFSRYFAYFPPESSSGATSTVVGRRWCSVGFGSELDRIAENTRNTWGMASHEIVEQHTLLPYYGAFLEPSDYLERVRKMCSPGEKVQGVGSSVARFHLHDTMRYCPVCVSEDLVEFGETYWRRGHQLTGVTICTVHDQILFACEATKHSKRAAFHDATQRVSLGGSECVSFTGPERRLATEISKRCIAVLSGECNKWTKYEIGLDYTQAAREQGFNFGKDKTDTNFLADSFMKFFGEKLLLKINFNFGYGGRKPFRNGGSKSPLTNVLVQMFLEQHVEDGGFKGFLAETPLYGWKCPNPRANHPDNFRVPHVVRRKSRLGYDYFHAKCSCGFGFAFHKALDEDPLMPDVSATSHWSLFHQKEARKLFEKYLSVRAVACAMKISHRTASKLISCERSKFKLSPEQIEKLRRHWERHPSLATYQVLLKHDREWMLEAGERQKVIGQLPVPTTRDSDLASEIRAAITRTRQRGGEVTMDTLSHEIGFQLVLNHLDDYPLSQAEVLAVCPIPPRSQGRGKGAKTAATSQSGSGSKSR
ncbi:TnsD family Tn7-like transposition protein [Bradyrhizobium vignae]|uniref:TniQ family protein n=1 Tax=Bradyrhizobium vignae TaxID=1549949 RepID=A0ABS3ZTJ3_9BRAD|nr:TnsD family Tn7-like transposition protein [Bradyrhizobium vignae]MBP0111472.1 TniQ family protein [Bradyrhizobium vignae]